MGSYSIISETGNALVQLLRQNMVPDIILNRDAINLCDPQDKGDITLGIYLYDIRESEEIRMNGVLPLGWNQQKYPPIYLSLYYMITAYSKSDVKFKAAEEHSMLGRVIQIIKDNPVLQPGGIKIEMINMDTQEKLKLWNVPNTVYKPSLFYKMTPIMLESTKVRDITRVIDIDLTVKE